eukprot:TRINITY_DN13814_c0_g1_i1.p1 TRINITY_DN13814_c0_g1~~TRINITY_DN13814_c0_g1_i1.p1  ORF type:complete len:198 (+),score=60.24 TRINITY_DN13814_c0_g1_i1:292-885(+)
MGYVWRLVVFYLPLFMYILFEIVIYVIVFRSATKIFSQVKFSDTFSAKAKQTPGLAILRRLVVYPIIFVLVWIFPITNRIQNWANPDHNIFALFLLQVLTAPAFGLCNSLFYTYDIALLTRYRNTLRQHGCCANCLSKTEEAVEQDDVADNTCTDAMDINAVAASGGSVAGAAALGPIGPAHTVSHTAHSSVVPSVL